MTSPTLMSMRAAESERYVASLRRKYDDADLGDKEMWSMMVGAAESVLAIWLCPESDLLPETI